MDTFKVSAENTRLLLKQANLSQRAAARELDVDERTMRRYCLGEIETPVAVLNALRWLRLIHSNERIIELIDKGALFGYATKEGGDVDVTASEKQRYEEINTKLRTEVRRIARKK